MKFLNIFFLGLLGSIHASPTRNVKIIGGTEVTAGQFPYAAAITYSTSDGNYFCGGSLLSTEWVISAGHCVYQAVRFQIILGSTKVDGSDSTSLKLSTSTSFAHDNFDPETFANDVGLIKFHIAISLTDYIQPVSLPQKEVDDNSVVVVIGWGQTSDEQEGLSKNLMRASVVTIPNTECKSYFGNQILDSMICVEGNFNEKACNGDLGGPLIQHRFNEPARIVGISSFLSSLGCESFEPSGYTRVFAVLDWISSTSGIAN